MKTFASFFCRWLTCAFALGLFCLISQTSRAALPARPNILFIYTDDQRYDAMGWVQKEQGDKGRFPWLQTPNMDRFAADSTSFSNAFVTTSLCSPSRASFLTGQFVHTHGIADNLTELPVNTVTYPALLHAAGYVTGFVGKWHMHSQLARPGFDFAASFTGQGKYEKAVFYLNGGPGKEVSTKWVDETSADYAIKFLQENKDHPFCLLVGFKSVHDPRHPAAPDVHLYANDKLGENVPNLNDRAPYLPSWRQPITNLTDENNLNYFRCLTSADRQLGRVLDAVKDLGLDQNTIIIYTSDNGYFLGEHQITDKRAGYEEGMRIPFLIRVPSLTPDRHAAISQMILNVDVAPTVLDFAGVPIPKTMQGRSLRPLLEGKVPADWPTSFLYEYFYEKPFITPTVVGVRTENDKLLTYPGHPEWTELFELNKDPYEIRNQARNPEKKILMNHLTDELTRLKASSDYHTPATAMPDTFNEDQKAPRRLPNDPGSPYN